MNFSMIVGKALIIKAFICFIRSGVVYCHVANSPLLKRALRFSLSVRDTNGKQQDRRNDEGMEIQSFLPMIWRSMPETALLQMRDRPHEPSGDFDIHMIFSSYLLYS